MKNKDGGDSDTKDLSPAEIWKNASMLLETKHSSVKERLPSFTTDFSLLAHTPSDCKTESDHMRRELCISVLFTHTPPALHPQCALHIFDEPEIYSKLDIDTLFFIFYSHPNTMRQYFAARQLKKYSWRYHKKYKAWFQRLEEPQLITEYYEKGTFLYFDYENMWQVRQKDNFVFEYKELENVEMI